MTDTELREVRGSAEWIEQFKTQPELQIADSILEDYGRAKLDSKEFRENRQYVANRIYAFARAYANRLEEPSHD